MNAMLDQSTQEHPLTILQQRILDLIQQEFPICADPYGEIGRQVGCTREEAHQAVRDLRDRRVIRRIGASFVPVKLGYVSVLVGARVDADHLEAVAAHVGAYTEVTHNYERPGIYNLWFTVIAESEQRMAEIIEDAHNCVGVQALYALPAKRTFKIRVDFKFGKGDGDA